MSGDAPDLDLLPRLGQLDVAAGLGGQVDDHRAPAHPLDHVRRDQQRGAPAGDCGGGDDNVGLRDVLADQLPLLAEELLRLLARIPALALLGLERELDERRAKRWTSSLTAGRTS